MDLNKTQRFIDRLGIGFYFKDFAPDSIVDFYNAKFAEYKARCKKITNFQITETDFLDYELKKIATMQPILYDDGISAMHHTKISEMYIDFLKKRLAICGNSTDTDTDKNEPQTQSNRQFTSEQIDILKTYFVATFKGMGQNTNHFEENLLIDLKKNRVGIEYAKIAKLIYESPKSVTGFKKKPFSQWYETFCILMGIEKCKYKKSQITIDDTIKREFYYLIT